MNDRAAGRRRRTASESIDASSRGWCPDARRRSYRKQIHDEGYVQPALPCPKYVMSVTTSGWDGSPEFARRMFGITAEALPVQRRIPTMQPRQFD